MASPFAQKIEDAVSEHALSYIMAMEATIHAPSSILSDYNTLVYTMATGLERHYLPGFISFANGTINTLPNDRSRIIHELYKQELQSKCHDLDVSGVGLAITHVLEKFRYEVVSDSSAICWLTWRISPIDTEQFGTGWEWQNIYVFRRKFDATGVMIQGWELELIDKEVDTFMDRTAQPYQKPHFDQFIFDDKYLATARTNYIASLHPQQTVTPCTQDITIPPTQDFYGSLQSPDAAWYNSPVREFKPNIGSKGMFACNGCRDSKGKCDEQQPCKKCTRRGIDCVRYQRDKAPRSSNDGEKLAQESLRLATSNRAMSVRPEACSSPRS